MFDTSVLLAGLATNHEHHDLARPVVAAAREGPIAGLVLAEAFARLRGFPFHFDVVSTIELLAPWSRAPSVLATSSEVYEAVMGVARSLNLGGSIHDLLIAETYGRHDIEFVTLDGRQARLASGRGLAVRHLAP